jgi:hypothetical protein
VPILLDWLRKNHRKATTLALDETLHDALGQVFENDEVDTGAKRVTYCPRRPLRLYDVTEVVLGNGVAIFWGHVPILNDGSPSFPTPIA